MSDAEIVKWFQYQAPTPDQIETMQRFRSMATDLAHFFCQHSSGPDQTYALRKLKETLMAMNAALVSPSPVRK